MAKKKNVAESSPIDSNDPNDNNAPTPPEMKMSTEIQKAAVTAIENRPAGNILAERLPARYREDVLFLQRPSSEQLLGIIEKLPGEYRENMITLAAKTRVKKQGAHTARQGFSPIQVRVYQGVGNDPVRPAKMTPGEFYTSDSKVLGEKFHGVVLGFYEGRTMWPPKDSDSKAPLCYSLDRMEGSRYGSCGNCPNSQKPYTQGGCAKDVTVWFLIVDSENAGIYSMQFSKSSFGSGEALTRILSKSENVWDRWVTFEAQARTEKDRKWYVIKATPVSDAKIPANNYTPRECHPLYEALSVIVDSDVYYPALADVYDRSRNSMDSSANAAGATGDTFDEKALLGPDTGDNADYSKDV